MIEIKILFLMGILAISFIAIEKVIFRCSKDNISKLFKYRKNFN